MANKGYSPFTFLGNRKKATTDRNLLNYLLFSMRKYQIGEMIFCIRLLNS